jgi:hypothetical protein
MPAIQAMPRLPDLPYKSRTKIDQNSQNSKTTKPLLRSPNTPKCSSTFIHRPCAGKIFGAPNLYFSGPQEVVQ